MNINRLQIKPKRSRINTVMSIERNLLNIKSALPKGVSLCAVSKFHAAEKILSAYNAGQRMFGESRVQELCTKSAQLPHDIEWHFIGHLQTNKVKQLVPVASMIESVDSPRLLAEINRQAAKIGRVVPVLLEIHVAQEQTKSGFFIAECRQFIDEGTWQNMPNISIRGLMTMASNTEDTSIVEADFAKAEQFFNELKADYFSSDDAFSIRSWGMSGDYPIALRHSANIVRIGTAIFGAREY